MPAVQEKIESKIVDLSKEAFDVFCDDISAMFEVDISCNQIDMGIQTVKGIKKHFKKVSTIHTVKAEGELDGTFHLIFDQGGLFTLAGVIVMLPEQRVLDMVKRGTLEDAEGMNDAVGEVGNLLVGTWDRVFREEMTGHEHFSKERSFIGSPWEKPEEVIGAGNSDEFECILYEMTIGSYPSFKCGVLFTGQLYQGQTTENDKKTEETTSAPASDMEDAPEETDQTPDIEEPQVAAPETEPQTSDTKDDDTKTESPEEKNEASEEVEEPPQDTVTEDPPTEAETDEPAESDNEETDSPETVSPPESQPEENVPEPLEQVSDEATEKEPEPGIEEPVIHETVPDITEVSEVSEKQTIKMTSSPMTDLKAEQIMDTHLVWAGPDESVNDILTKMQEHDAGYALIGKDQKLDGILSKSNVLGAMSPYLRPVFAKWRRPADDASLNIKIKWIMSRPVRTVNPQTPVTVIIEKMLQFGGRCLPVTDQGGKVVGLVTVFDVLRALVPQDQISLSGRTPQAPCLMV